MEAWTSNTRKGITPFSKGIREGNRDPRAKEGAETLENNLSNSICNYRGKQPLP